MSSGSALRSPLGALGAFVLGDAGDPPSGSLALGRLRSPRCSKDEAAKLVDNGLLLVAGGDLVELPRDVPSWRSARSCDVCWAVQCQSSPLEDPLVPPGG